MQRIFLSILVLLLLLPNLFTAEVNTVLPYNGKEKFDPSLSRINSISLLTKYTDSIANSKQIQPGSYEYGVLLESIIEDRFYHGFSHFTLAQNWIAALAGKFIKEDYACIVQPEKIMQQPNAACSQQAIVMMQVLLDKNIHYRSLGFPHHYAIEVLMNKEWYFFDANMEPGISKEQRMLENWQHRNDKLKQYYDKRRCTNLDFQFGNGLTATVGIVDEVPAQNAKAFHTATAIMSKIAWLLPLLLIFYRSTIKIKLPFISFISRRKKAAVYLPA